MTLVEEYVVFGLVADERTEILADYAVPVGPVLLVKFLLDMLGHQKFSLQVVHRVLDLRLIKGTYFIASAIMSDPSGISTMFSFRIASVIL